MPFATRKIKPNQNVKKKPPPRPPPPNFAKYRSKSTIFLNEPNNGENLIQWSPPSSPQIGRRHQFGGSVSSSFSSSNSSLASSKKSIESDNQITNNIWPMTSQPALIQGPEKSNFQSYLRSKHGINKESGTSATSGPTIIRPHIKRSPKLDDSILSSSPPMPSIPPPSPPKVVETEIQTPYAIALFDFTSSHATDLDFQAGDLVILLRRINNDWIQGKVLDKEGMFPEKFVDIQVPLKGEENIVIALYDFKAQMNGDLSFKEGQKILVTKRISDEWLYGELNGQSGQFPSNFVNRVPKKLQRL